MLSSGVADWWGDIAPFPTFEGVNPVMFQQSMRLLLKNANRIAKGKKPLDFFAYLTKADELLQSAKNSTANAQDFKDLQFLEDTLAFRAAYKVQEVLSLLNES